MSDQRLVCEMSTLLLLTTAAKSSPRRRTKLAHKRQHAACRVVVVEGYSGGKYLTRVEFQNKKQKTKKQTHTPWNSELLFLVNSFIVCDVHVACNSRMCALKKKEVIIRIRGSLCLPVVLPGSQPEC